MAWYSDISITHSRVGLVKSVKLHLRKLLSNSTPTVEEFETLLRQIESCLNSRPLMPANDDPESCDVLTPGHFLNGSAIKFILCQDGAVRVVHVKTAQSEFIRPISKLVRLLKSNDV